jgi:alkanesulfonate monooxygenase SsuD/methylene tetrahydromethanopterin reductase-like flavin-dependent oxidoreductase (luciferase family)
LDQPFRLGFLTHVEGAGDPSRIYRETLELFATADQLGFDVAWVAQHHFKELAGRLPALFPFLAAAAERTRRIRLGTAIAILPFDNPLRVAEEAAVVDTLSGGRLELGVGSGSDPGEFRAFGLDVARRHELTTEGLEILQRGLRGENLGEGGLRLQPPAPTLADRLWQSALSAAGAQYVARHGVGLLLSRAAWGHEERTDQLQAPVVQAYLDAWNAQFGKPRIALSRGIYPAADKQAALEGVREGVLRTADAMIRQGQFPAGRSLEYYCQRLHVYYGHPDEVAGGLTADQVLPYATDLILQFSPAIPPLDQAIQMLEQTALRIAPALGWRPKLGEEC